MNPAVSSDVWPFQDYSAGVPIIVTYANGPVATGVNQIVQNPLAGFGAAIGNFFGGLTTTEIMVGIGVLGLIGVMMMGSGSSGIGGHGHRGRF